jgi:DNA-binding transcriptional LysR family regulator
LERSRSGVRLTSDGVKLLPYAQKVCQDYAKLQAQVDEISGLEAGLIRIGTFSSVATHWLPRIIKKFQADYPHIDYELLLGDYAEIETWIAEGRVDCGFLKLPTRPEFETIFLEQDPLLVVLPQKHPLAKLPKVPVQELLNYPFMLLDKGEQSEVGELLEQCGLHPQVHFTTWDDYAIMSMVESGLGIAILPQLILRRAPYKLVLKELAIPAFRKIGLALREKKTASQAVKRFLDYLPYRA